MEAGIELQGMVPDHLKVRQSRILLDSLEVMTDIGFHDFEVGAPQQIAPVRIGMYENDSSVAVDHVGRAIGQPRLPLQRDVIFVDRLRVGGSHREGVAARLDREALQSC